MGKKLALGLRRDWQKLGLQGANRWIARMLLRLCEVAVRGSRACGDNNRHMH